jgi:Flp pilus assembly protein TadD
MSPYFWIKRDRLSAKSQTVLALLLMGTLSAPAHAGDIRISFPKHTKPTPVQRLNQKGVKEVEKHDYKGARALFYKAYLLDPDDPFTLNNLGYVAELEGQIDRAQRYYALAQAQRSDAVVYKSTNHEALGKPVDEIAGDAATVSMQINRLNVQAIGLLQKGKVQEADLALQKALKLDPENPFTLNNLGFAKEKEGELDEAYGYYVRAANQHSDASVLVTTEPSWRGQSIEKIATANAGKIRDLMEHQEDIGLQVARLNTQGVAAINRNDYQQARQDFQQAYRLDPKNAFALNNMGYLAELDGDRETADYYYGKASEARQANMKVAYATRSKMKGMKMAAVADVNDKAVVKATEDATAALRAEGGPIVLHYRNNKPVSEPATPPQPMNEGMNPPANEDLRPLPDSQQPPAQPQQQPNTSATPTPTGGLLMPLPEDQQPPMAGEPEQQRPNSPPPH